MNEPNPLGKKRILVVDDVEMFSALMADLLSREGFEVLTAKDGLEAIQAIKHELPHLDLVLLDLLLPHLTGFEVLKEIRSGKLGQDLPVLAITGVFKKPSQIEMLKKLGANGYMTKDQKPEEIVRRVKSILGMDAGAAAARAKAEAGKAPEIEKLDPIEFLSRTEVFSGLSRSQLEKVAKALLEMRLAQETKIFSEGDLGDSFFIIGSGTVRVVKVGEAKEDEILAILKPGMSFGEMALIEKETRSATVISNEPGRVLQMNKDDFEKLLRSDKELALVVYQNFVRMLSARLRKTSESLTFSRAMLEELRKGK